MREAVEKAIEKIRPALQADGGDIRLVDVADKVVTVELQGACRGCPMSQLTLRMGVERAIKQMVPEVERVEALGMPAEFANLRFGWDEKEEKKPSEKAEAK